MQRIRVYLSNGPLAAGAAHALTCERLQDDGALAIGIRAVCGRDWVFAGIQVLQAGPELTLQCIGLSQKLTLSPGPVMVDVWEGAPSMVAFIGLTVGTETNGVLVSELFYFHWDDSKTSRESMVAPGRGCARAQGFCVKMKRGS